IAVDIELEHHAGVIAGSARLQWLDTDEPELVEIDTVDEYVDRSHRVILAHIVIERCRKQRALPAIQPFNKALHEMPRQIAGNLIVRITANRAFSHNLGPKWTQALQQSPRYSICTSARASSDRVRPCLGVSTAFGE